MSKNLCTKSCLFTPVDINSKLHGHFLKMTRSKDKAIILYSAMTTLRTSVIPDYPLHEAIPPKPVFGLWQVGDLHTCDPGEQAHWGTGEGTDGSKGGLIQDTWQRGCWLMLHFQQGYVCCHHQGEPLADHHCPPGDWALFLIGEIIWGDLKSTASILIT